MATFVLVHGAWHGGWCWRDTARALRAAGHTVFTPTHTGLGERAHQNGEAITLETHIRDVAGCIEAEELDDVILCGHSYGGMVITGVADRMPERIRAHALICFLALLLHRVMRPKLTEFSPAAALRKLKAIQLHRFTADGKTVSGLTATSEETRSIFHQLDLPLPDQKTLRTR